MFKLYQYDKKIWKDSDNPPVEYAIHHTYQYGIINKKRTILNVIKEKELNTSSIGVSIYITILRNSLFEIDINFKNYILSFTIWSEYFEGW